jgi:hypothetical protein
MIKRFKKVDELFDQKSFDQKLDTFTTKSKYLGTILSVF